MVQRQTKSVFFSWNEQISSSAAMFYFPVDWYLTRAYATKLLYIELFLRWSYYIFVLLQKWKKKCLHKNTPIKHREETKKLLWLLLIFFFIVCFFSLSFIVVVLLRFHEHNYVLCCDFWTIEKKCAKRS